VAYKEGDHVTNVYDLGLKLGKRFKEFYHSYGKQLELWIEPGKFLVSEAGFLLANVNVVKTTPSVTFAGVDSGLNHLIRPMMYDAYHEIVNISNPTGDQKIYTVVGIFVGPIPWVLTGNLMKSAKEICLLSKMPVPTVIRWHQTITPASVRLKC